MKINGNRLKSEEHLFDRINTVFQRDHVDAFLEPVFSHFNEEARYEQDNEETFNRILFLIRKYIDPKTPKAHRKIMDLVFKVFMGVSLIALGIVLEVLFSGQGIPFWPNISVIGNVQSIIGGFSDQGLLGLVAIWILYHIYNRK